MPGTYNGGGTVIGPGRPWPVEPAFEPATPPVIVPQAEVLTALGISKTIMKTRKRGDILMNLVAEGLLLDTGQPNPDHPKVVAILNEKAKKEAALVEENRRGNI